MMRNRDSEALAAFQAADLLARRLASPHYLIPWIRALLLLAMVRLGQTGPPGQFLAGLSDTDREHGEIRIADAALRLAQGTRVPRPPRSPRSWTVGSGGLAKRAGARRTCWRRSPGMRSASRTPPTVLWSAR